MAEHFTGYSRPHDVMWYNGEYVITDSGNHRIVAYNPSTRSHRIIINIPKSWLYGLAPLSDLKKGFLVADNTGGRVYRIENYKFKYGWGLDINSPTGIIVHNGEVFVASFRDNSIKVFSESGKYLRTFGTSYLTKPWFMATNSKGHVYVADSKRINVFTTGGDFIQEFRIETQGRAWLYRGIAIDRNDKVYVTARNFKANFAWALETVTFLDADHKHVKDITAGRTSLHYLRGLCVNHERNELVVVDGEHHRLKTFNL